MLLFGLAPAGARRATAPAPPKSAPRLRDLYPGAHHGASLNLIDERFGKLVVVERLRSGGAGVGVVWRCACDCGGSREETTRRLNEGKATSCGCANRLDVNLTGQTFGRLKVVALDHAAIRGLVWACECECGQARLASTSELRHFVVRSCSSEACKAALRAESPPQVPARVEAAGLAEVVIRIASEHRVSTRSIFVRRKPGRHVAAARLAFYRYLREVLGWGSWRIAGLVGRSRHVVDNVLARAESYGDRSKLYAKTGPRDAGGRLLATVDQGVIGGGAA